MVVEVVEAEEEVGKWREYLMDRTAFYETIDIGNGSEYDYLHNSLSNFTLLYPVQYYRVSEEDVMRPDLISYKAYGTVQYWWVIMLVNGVQNPLVDLTVGMLLKVPSVLDIYTFAKQYSIK